MSIKNRGNTLFWGSFRYYLEKLVLFLFFREGDKLIKDTMLNSSSNNSDIISTVIGIALHDPQAIAHLVELIANQSITAFQKIPYIQLQNYLNRIKEIEDNYGDACKLSEKLFYDTKNRDDNALRIIKCVVNIDTQNKLDYICNVTESMLLEMIDINMMFRLFNVVSNSLPEDLLYLSSIIEKSGPFVGNVNVFALVQCGLMISSGINPNVGIEEQEYCITQLGYILDKYAISLHDDERLEWYNKRGILENRKYEIPKMVQKDDKEIYNMVKHNMIIEKAADDISKGKIPSQKLW
jgi:hypothetical protein